MNICLVRVFHLSLRPLEGAGTKESVALPAPTASRDCADPLWAFARWTNYGGNSRYRTQLAVESWMLKGDFIGQGRGEA